MRSLGLRHRRQMIGKDHRDYQGRKKLKNGDKAEVEDRGQGMGPAVFNPGLWQKNL